MSDATTPPGRPRIDVVGLGPAGPELLTVATRDLVEAARAVRLRTRRHPATAAFPTLPSFDHHYQEQPTFDDVYRSIVDDLLDIARREHSVVYAVPGSPVVAERTVVLLREAALATADDVDVVVHPALSFLDLAFARLGVDPVATGVRIVDAESFAAEAAGERGPLLVAQCWSPELLSEVKLSTDAPPGVRVTVLHHLGLDDERVWDVEWDDLDRLVAPDHLTSLWIPTMAAPVGAELVRLDELMHDLRQRCPWDRRQTHSSLARHLMEESYEALEAIDALAAVDGIPDPDQVDPVVEERAVALLEEELGDLLFQVYFHATLAAEAGRFSLADVARGVHDKLVSRHPHLFPADGVPGNNPAPESDLQMASDWEARKKAEKQRSSITEGIPVALPALALAAKLQRKGLTVGMPLPSPSEDARAVADAVGALAEAIDRSSRGEADGDSRPGEHGQGESDSAARIGEALFALVNLARELDIDAESALRARAAAFRRSVETLG